jgi:hypothetical protein
MRYPTRTKYPCVRRDGWSMRLMPALGRAGEEAPPPRVLPRFAADFDVADLRFLALVRLVERDEERLRVDLLGTEVWWLEERCRDAGARPSGQH